MSGHSKWAQIKHKKAATDAKKGVLFSKLVREIAVAARSGDPNPDTNARLLATIEHARSLGLPKDNIERALERATGGDKESHLEEFLYEAIGPRGASILIEGITDNRNRSLAEIKQILARRDAKLALKDSLLWNFEKIGSIDVIKAEDGARNDEEAELTLIESGARDFRRQKEGWTVETEFPSLNSIRKELEKRSLVVKAYGHDYKAKSQLEVPEAERNLIESLVEELSEHDDVQEVYTNLAN
ncbi:MAG: hypothetical protein A3C07_00615 [Candidatus Sungbacteria bacterium RIFCSPHIGHO2_02_FULL_47_11]|uniref:Probable transcriptional regulatory protein A3C07_00615 n=1 Tax=Candidatus Sungbacteria bacterium RIFCSPHIGHO2_02_FULL_47_11 TaxID=1802270 RepID=A0A1G2KH95_9BACT|nr:MAG: hypothetical protein A3C07_00615 [Candidatus Sungbacteria bacterium RIFCSPHIGHO2_02_FULL_47_11]